MERSKIEGLIEPVIADLGYELVRVRFQRDRVSTLQIMAERRDRKPMRVEDCAMLSRRISVLLDEADPTDDDFTLEVSSPGIDRPLMKPADYARFAGHEAKLEVDPAIGGRKRFAGTIAGIDGGALRLEFADGAISLPFAAIKGGKLVLTDRLIAAATLEAEAAEPDGATQIQVPRDLE